MSVFADTSLDTVNIAKIVADFGMKGGDVLELQDNKAYRLNSHDGKLVFDNARIIIRGKPGTWVNSSPTSYLSGIRGIDFQDLTFRGRVNIDDVSGISRKLTFTNCKFLSAPTAETECLKLTRTQDVLISNCYLERTTDGGASDRLLDIVGGKNINVINNNFYNGNNGAIQAKGGVFNLFFSNNFVNMCGQRAVQIGGSTCWNPPNSGCWGFENGKPVPPSTFGWEALDCAVFYNVIISNISAISLSTQSGTLVNNNLVYFPYETGGMYFFRLLQEVEAQTMDEIKPSENLVFKKNVFLYPTTRADGKSGINGSIMNWNPGQNFNSMEFSKNAAYSVTPITNPQFGKMGIYPHRHFITDGPNQWTPVKWKNELIDQKYPDVIDWGLPTMRCTAPEYANVGIVEGVIVGAANMPLGVTVGAPPAKEDYPEGTEFYGWGGNGSLRIPDTPPPPPTDNLSIAVEKLQSIKADIIEIEKLLGQIHQT